MSSRPPVTQGTDEEKQRAFQQTMFAIRRRMELLINLPEDKLAQAMIQASARQLAQSAS